MQGYQSLIRQMRVHVAMASHWARHLWRVDIQRRGAMRKESRIIQIANYLDMNGNNYPYQGRIYSVHGIAPTFPACVGGSTIVTKIVVWK